MDPFDEVLAEIAAGTGVAVIKYHPEHGGITVRVSVGGPDDQDKADIAQKEAAALPLLPADLETAQLSGAEGEELIYTTVDVALERAGQQSSPN